MSHLDYDLILGYENKEKKALGKVGLHKTLLVNSTKISQKDINRYKDAIISLYSFAPNYVPKEITHIELRQGLKFSKIINVYDAHWGIDLDYKNIFVSNLSHNNIDNYFYKNPKDFNSISNNANIDNLYSLKFNNESIRKFAEAVLELNEHFTHITMSFDKTKGFILKSKSDGKTVDINDKLVLNHEHSIIMSLLNYFRVGTALNLYIIDCMKIPVGIISAYINMLNKFGMGHIIVFNPPKREFLNDYNIITLEGRK